MIIQECMSSDVHTISPGTPLRHAAEQMAINDIGSLPVAENLRLVGMVTDRDIAIRGIGMGLGPDAQASEVMSDNALYCYVTDEVPDVLANMGENQVRRLPVVTENKQLIGLISISDLVKAQPELGAASLAQVAEPSALHSQTLE